MEGKARLRRLLPTVTATVSAAQLAELLAAFLQHNCQCCLLDLSQRGWQAACGGRHLCRCPCLPVPASGTTCI